MTAPSAPSAPEASAAPAHQAPAARHVLLVGATGTIGTAVRAALIARGHRVTCLLRPGRAAPPEWQGMARDMAQPAPAEVIHADVTDPASLARDAFAGRHYDALVSCMASRSGTAKDAWAIDHAAHRTLLAAAEAAGLRHMVLLSAICVQKPVLAFQQAKLAFEAELQRAALTWSIVRPTAFFKSLSGQIARVQAGKPFLMFGDGRLTACKPISDRDLAAYIADCLTDPARHNRVLPIGGPGPAITPRDQLRMLAGLMGRPVRSRQVPVAMMDAIIAGLSALGRVSPRMRARAEFARIGRYYATESMLVLDPATGRYDADATPETGTDRLRDHYADVLAGRARVDLGDHAAFGP